MKIILWILVLIMCIIFSLCATICVSKKCTLLNILIGSLSIFFVIYFANFLTTKTYIKAIAIFISLVYTAFFYNEFNFSSKTIILFVVEVSYVLIVLGLFYAVMDVFNQSKQFSLIITFVLCVGLLTALSYVLKIYFKKVNLKNLYYKCRILSIKGCIELWMYLDSGNMVTAGADNLPVVFINKSKLKYVDGKVCLVDVYSAVGKAKKIEGIFAENFYIFNNGKWIKQPVVIGVVEDKFYAFDGILNLECI